MKRNKIQPFTLLFFFSAFLSVNLYAQEPDFPNPFAGPARLFNNAPSDPSITTDPLIGTLPSSSLRDSLNLRQTGGVATTFGGPGTPGGGGIGPGDPGYDNAVPFDGGVAILLTIGIGHGLKINRSKRKKITLPVLH